MKKVEFKNYAIYFLVCLITLLLLFLFVKSYNSNVEYKNSVNDRMSFLKEITFTIYKDYIVENPNYIMYISNSKDNLDEFENALKDQLLKKDFVNEIIYFNSYKDSKKMLKKINKEYGTSFSKIPNLIIVNNNQIMNTYYIDDDSNILDILNMIEAYYD